MNDMQHQMNHIWFKEKNLKKSTYMSLSICFRNHVHRIIDVYLLFITKLFQKAKMILLNLCHYHVFASVYALNGVK